MINNIKKLISQILIVVLIISLFACTKTTRETVGADTIRPNVGSSENAGMDTIRQEVGADTIRPNVRESETVGASYASPSVAVTDDVATTDDVAANRVSGSTYETFDIYVDFTAPYATFSIINDGHAVLYKLNKNVENYKNKTIAVNAGHGTKGGSKIKTFSHPDYSPKVSGGSTAGGAIISYAVSEGTTFLNGMTEANANLVVAYKLKDILLNNGYSVLMIRENDDCRLDNIARTVIANENADAHIAIHFDSTASDKGIFFITPYNNEAYLNMEPVKSNAHRIRELGKCLIESFREMGEKIWKDKGSLQGDLTQISFSTNASVDIELGDRATVVTEEKAEQFAEGIYRGINKYFNYE